MDSEPLPIFLVLLRFSAKKDQARLFMDGHKQWVKRGFDEGVFLLAGSLEPDSGGAIVASKTTRASLLNRVNEDPFVVEDVVTAEIIEISPAKADPRLRFLLD